MMANIISLVDAVCAPVLSCHHVVSVYENELIGSYIISPRSVLSVWYLLQELAIMNKGLRNSSVLTKTYTELLIISDTVRHSRFSSLSQRQYVK